MGVPTPLLPQSAWALNIAACNGHSPCWLTRKGIVDNAEANNYYNTIDPSRSKDTLDKWLAQNGFNSGRSPIAHAVYFNNGDLQIGRDMYCRQESVPVNNGTQLTAACYVSNYGPAPNDVLNYPNEARALTEAVAAQSPGAAKHPFATVAMEFLSTEPGSAQVDFYFFDKFGNRGPSAALDVEGDKSVPTMCMACHGGTYNSQTHKVVGAAFLPFDVFSFHYSGIQPFRKEDQEEEFRKLNKMVQDLAAAVPGFGDTIVEMVNVLYPQGVGNAGSTASDAQVPPGWTSQPRLYKELVVPYCRACHVASAVAPLRTYEEFRARASRIRSEVCGKHEMPQAQVPFFRVWTPDTEPPAALLNSTTLMPPPGPNDPTCPKSRPGDVRVPDVESFPVQLAKEAIEAAGLKPKFTCGTNCTDRHHVFRQRPAPDTEVRPGTEVFCSVKTGPID